VLSEVPQSTLGEVGSARSNLFIDVGNLELPQAADLVAWQTSAIDLSIDRVLCDTEVPGYLLN
jgi:hypothetical protein